MRYLIYIISKTIGIAAILGMALLISACTKEPQPNPNDNNNTLSDTTLNDVAYGSHPKQRYDIYLPANRNTTVTPVIVMIHGGAWKAGDKSEFTYYMNLLKSAWPKAAIVNINYRLASNANNIHHNEIIADIDSAISHLVQHQVNYQVSNRYGIMGYSAGGQLAMIYAYKYNTFNNIKCVANISGPSIINDWSWYNSFNIWLGTTIGDILTEYVGQPWDTTVYREVSPYWNVTAQSQPTILFHGSADPIVPVYQSQWMHGQLNSFTVPNQYHEYVAFHSFDNNQSADIIAKMVAFFKGYL